MNLHLKLQPEDLIQIREQVIVVICDQIKQIDSSNFRKHAYTVKEVAEQIGYCTKTVREFITKGRRDRRGNQRLLPAKEITSGDYRILPHELDVWLSYF